MKRKSDVELVVFDLDGTLLDTSLYIVLNYVHLFDRYHVPVPPLKTMVYFSGPPLTEILPRHFPEVPLPELLEEFERFSLLHANHYSCLYEGEKEVLSKLKEAGYRLAVLTNKRGRAMEDNLSFFGIDSFFDAFLPLDENPKPKPDPCGIFLLQEKLHVKGKTVVIGDSVEDIECGKRASCRTGLVTFGLKDTGTIEADERYSSYQDIERSFLL